MEKENRNNKNLEKMKRIFKHYTTEYDEELNIFHVYFKRYNEKNFDNLIIKTLNFTDGYEIISGKEKLAEYLHCDYIPELEDYILRISFSVLELVKKVVE